MINLKKLLEKEYPAIAEKKEWIQNLAIKLLNKLLYINEINNFMSENSHLGGTEFIDEAFDLLQFTYMVSNKDFRKIPAEGRLICVANHPIGSLDGLALVKTIREIRKDVKIVTNSLLSEITNLNEFFFPVDIEKEKRPQRQIFESIGEALENEEAVIIFPAAEVSRLRGYHVVDLKWKKGAVFFAKKYKSPILPIYVSGKNSTLFYGVSIINKKLSTLLLAHELFNKKNKTIKLRIGEPIPAKAFTQSPINVEAQIKLLKKHVYKIGKNKTGIYKTEKNIIHPVDKKSLFKEIQRSKVLGFTNDNKRILITNQEFSPTLLKEIARLREHTFRSVGEGTGKKWDTDKFDQYYHHLIVWDDEELEIVGSYRIGCGNQIIEQFGHKGFYSSTLFNFTSNLINDYLPYSIELGRSFVQKKYWNTNALHYLWLGLGAFLAQNPQVKYMFGPVSISNSYDRHAKELIISYFKKWFPSKIQLAHANKKIKISKSVLEEFEKHFNMDTPQKEYRILKNLLKPYGLTVPVLYKHYSDLCQPGGVKFLDFSIDPEFENCVDGLILVDNSLITEKKKDRYINVFLNRLEEEKVSA